MNRSSLKFLVDVGVGLKVELYLRENGHDTLSVRDIDPRMPDEEILILAEKERRIVITMDKDFGELVYHSTMKHKGVLLLRLEDARGAIKVKVVSKILDEYSQQLPNSFAVYQNDKFRVKKIEA